MVVLGRGAPEQVTPVFDVAGGQFKTMEGRARASASSQLPPISRGTCTTWYSWREMGIVFGRGSGAVVLGRGVLCSWAGAWAGAVRGSVSPEGGLGGSTTARSSSMSSGFGGGGFRGRPRFFLLLGSRGYSSSGASGVGGALTGDGSRKGVFISFPARSWGAGGGWGAGTGGASS